MKHIITIAVALLATVSLQAQTYMMVYKGDTLVGGDTIVYQPSRTEVAAKLISLPAIYLIKTTDDEVYTDNNITYVQGSGHFKLSEVCGGGLCPQPSSYTLVSGKIDSTKFLSLHYTYDGTLPAGAYAMHKFTVGTIAESIEHGIGDTVGAPIESLTETTSIYVIVHNGDYTLGTTEPAVASSFEMYPTVVSAGQSVVLTTTDASARVAIYDVQGRLVQTAQLTNGTLPTSGMATGTYLVSLITSQGVSASQKLVVK